MAALFRGLRAAGRTLGNVVPRLAKKSEIQESFFRSSPSPADVQTPLLFFGGLRFARGEKELGKTASAVYPWSRWIFTIPRREEVRRIGKGSSPISIARPLLFLCRRCGSILLQTFAPRTKTDSVLFPRSLGSKHQRCPPLNTRARVQRGTAEKLFLLAITASTS